MSRRIGPPGAARPTDVILRDRWRPGDAELIVSLHRRGYASEGARFGGAFPVYVRETVDEAGLDRSGHASRVWFAERGGEALGCAAMIDRGARGQLRWVVILPEARGAGLGRALVQAALDYAAAQGWREVYLETTDGLDSSMALYRGFGFSLDSQQEADLWDGPGQFIVMTRRF